MFMLQFSVIIITIMIICFIFLSIYLYINWNNFNKNNRILYFLLIVGSVFNIFMYAHIIKIIKG